MYQNFYPSISLWPNTRGCHTLTTAYSTINNLTYHKEGRGGGRTIHHIFIDPNFLMSPWAFKLGPDIKGKSCRFEHQSPMWLKRTMEGGGLLKCRNIEIILITLQFSSIGQQMQSIAILYWSVLVVPAMDSECWNHHDTGHYIYSPAALLKLYII